MDPAKGKGEPDLCYSQLCPRPPSRKELCNPLHLAWPGAGLSSYYTDVNEHHNSNGYQRAAERKRADRARLICRFCQLLFVDLGRAFESSQSAPRAALCLHKLVFVHNVHTRSHPFCVILLEWKNIARAQSPLCHSQSPKRIIKMEGSSLCRASARKQSPVIIAAF